MHCGSIDNPKTAAARVLAYLRRNRGTWISSWALTLGARTTAVGTRVSEVRRQLGSDWRIEHTTQPDAIAIVYPFGAIVDPTPARGSYYRIVRVAEVPR